MQGSWCLALLVMCGMLIPADAQLRPRRVGVGAGGEAAPLEADSDGTDVESLLSAMGGGGADPTDMLSAMLKDNPMLQGLAQANPEMAEMLSNPAKMQEQIQQVAQMFSSDEGKQQLAEAQGAMREFLTDPDKMREGLEALKTNPMLKGLTDHLPPEFKQVMEDPALLSSAIEEMTKNFGDFANGDGLPDISKLGDMMGNLGSEELQAMMSGMGAAMGNEEGAANLLGDDGDDLKSRVREQLASMLRERQGAGSLDPEDF